jgi:tetratricopeptide (TPR) repeat protein
MTTSPTDIDFDRLWTYDQPAHSEAKFREVLEKAGASMPPGRRLELLTQIARAEGLQGRFAGADATLDGVERALKDGCDDATVRVRYLLERGRVLNSSGRPTEALPLFRQAFELAKHANQLGYVIDAAHMLAIAEPTTEQQIAWNLKGIELASSDPAQTRWLVALNNNLGETYRAAGEYDKALECFRGAMDAQRRLGRDVDRYARVDEAKMLRLLGRTSESLAKIQQLQHELEAQGDREDGFVIEELAESLLALDFADQAKPLFVKAYEKLKGVDWLEKDEAPRLARLKELASQ